MTEIADAAHQAIQALRSTEKQSERRAIAISALVLLVSIGTSYLVPQKFQFDLAFATATTLLAYIITVQHSRLGKFSAIDFAIENIDRSMEKGFVSVSNEFASIHDADQDLLVHVKASHRFAEKVTRLIEFEPIIQSCGMYSLRMALDRLSFKSIDKYIKLTGHEMAFSTYYHFWEKLLEYKINSPNRKIVAYITHASDIAAWEGRESKTLKDINRLHRQFVQASGFVFRIFIDCDPKQRRLQQYLTAMKHMRDAGLQCAYITPMFSRTLHRDDIDRDISIIDTGHSVEFHVGLGRRVTAFTLGNNLDHYDECMGQWIDYVHNVTSYDYLRHEEINLDDRKFLTDSRDSFVKALNSID
jgi:hypothetical protein